MMYLKGKCNKFKVCEVKEQRDKNGIVTQDVVKVLQRDGNHHSTINIFRTSSRVLINGPQYADFANEDLPLILEQIGEHEEELQEASREIKQSIEGKLAGTNEKSSPENNTPARTVLQLSGCPIPKGKEIRKDNSKGSTRSLSLNNAGSNQNNNEAATDRENKKVGLDWNVKSVDSTSSHTDSSKLAKTRSVLPDEANELSPKE